MWFQNWKQLFQLFIIGFSNRSIKEVKLVEKFALRNASLNIFYSAWAANSVIKDYGINSNLVYFYLSLKYFKDR